MSMLKRNLGDALRCRSDSARQRELVLRSIVHNIMLIGLRMKGRDRAGTSPFHALSNGSGSVVERYVYDPYGKQTVLNGAVDSDGAQWSVDSNGSDYAFRHGHQGGKLDAATALIHFRMREYSPELMRWVQQDPIGYYDGLNRYLYVGGRPTTNVDPAGLLLIAIGGTGSSTSQTGSIKYFADDYRKNGLGPAHFFHGPSGATLDNLNSASEAFKIEQGALQVILEELRRDPNQPIDLIGHSRGAVIATQLARELQKLGLSVRFLGLYDPVDMSFGYADGCGETIPSNVNRAAIAWSDPDIKSRNSWNRQDSRPKSIFTSFFEKAFPGTHGAIGGQPWRFPKNPGANAWTEMAAAITADQWIRQQLNSASFNGQIIVPDSATYRSRLTYNEDYK